MSLSKLGKVRIKKCSKTFVKELQSEFGRGRRGKDGVRARKPRNKGQAYCVPGKKPSYWKGGFSCDSHKNMILGSSLNSVELLFYFDIFVTNMEAFYPLF